MRNAKLITAGAAAKEAWMYRLALVVFLGIALVATAAHAARNGAGETTIAGSLSSQTGGNACDAAWVNTCASGNCNCLTYDGTASGLQNGTATIYLDIDILGATSQPNACFPTYANIQLNDETIYAVGATCGAIASTPSGFSGTLNLIGNYSVVAGGQGTASLSGTVDADNNSVALTLARAKRK